MRILTIIMLCLISSIIQAEEVVITLKNGQVITYRSDDIRNITFRSANPITVLSPNGGDVLSKGSNVEIVWRDTIDGNVAIQLWKGDVLATNIAHSVPSNGSYRWQMTHGYDVGSDYKIKIVSIDDPSVADYSNAFFSIR